MKRLQYESTDKDERRNLFQLLTTPIAQVNYIVFKRNLGRVGGHYHREKTEWFFVVFGTMKLTIQTKGHEPYVIRVAAGELVQIDPWEKHTFEGQALVMEFLSHPYDPEDTFNKFSQ